jgi:hypothetical protein
MSAFSPNCLEPRVYGGSNAPAAIRGKGGQKAL